MSYKYTITQYVIYHPPSKSFLQDIISYQKFDPSKEPSYSDALYGILTPNVITALRVRKRQDIEHTLKYIKSNCGFFKFSDSKQVTGATHFQIKEINLSFEYE